MLAPILMVVLGTTWALPQQAATIRRSIEGSVVDVQGRPATSVIVSAMSLDLAQREPNPQRVRTDSRGRYDLPVSTSGAFPVYAVDAPPPLLDEADDWFAVAARIESGAVPDRYAVGRSTAEIHERATNNGLALTHSSASGVTIRLGTRPDEGVRFTARREGHTLEGKHDLGQLRIHRTARSSAQIFQTPCAADGSLDFGCVPEWEFAVLSIEVAVESGLDLVSEILPEPGDLSLPLLVGTPFHREITVVADTHGDDSSPVIVALSSRRGSVSTMNARGVTATLPHGRYVAHAYRDDGTLGSELTLIEVDPAVDRDHWRLVLVATENRTLDIVDEHGHPLRMLSAYLGPRGRRGDPDTCQFQIHVRDGRSTLTGVPAGVYPAISGNRQCPRMGLVDLDEPHPRLTFGGS